MAVAVFTTTGGQTWTVPAGVTSISVEAIGGGGDGYYSGGGGGAYSQTTGLTVTPGGTVWLSVGIAGPQFGGSGGDSWANVASNAAPTLTSQGALAKGGQGQQLPTTQSLGGQSSAGVGNTKFSGGNGGLPATTITGGGGAAGPNGPGGNGGTGINDTVTCGGPGGANNGGNGGNATATPTGGSGGTNRLGSGAGSGGTTTTSPTSGTGGAGGGSTAQAGQTGGNGSTEIISAWGVSYGPGGGSGGGDTGGSAGNYGGGCSGYNTGSGPAGQGIVVITYTPPASNATFSTLPMMGVA